MPTTPLLIVTGCLLAAQSQPAATPVDRDDIPPKIEAFLEKCETSRRGAIARLEFELRGLKSRGATTPKAARRVTQIEASLRSLRANKQPVVAALHFPPEVGQIGRLPELICHVDQVLSPNEMLVTCRFKLKVRVVRNFRPRLETVVRPVSFLMRNVSTDRDNEGADLQLLDVFEITGRHTYRSRAGKSVRVLVLSPFDMQTVEPYFRAMKISQRHPPD